MGLTTIALLVAQQLLEQVAEHGEHQLLLKLRHHLPLQLLQELELRAACSIARITARVVPLGERATEGVRERITEV